MARAFYIPVGETEHIEGLTKNMIVTVNPAEVKAKASDHTIEKIAAMRGGDYSPALHQASDSKREQRIYPSTCKTLEALRRAGTCNPQQRRLLENTHDYLDRAKSYEKFRSRAKPVDVKCAIAIAAQTTTNNDGTYMARRRIMVDVEPVNEGFRQ